ncbi:MAG: AraC family transcriptional regulator [Clostridiaceae bacterium]|nr:AraC family transcriptional regulator [Clostridiaceae bacterium]
MLKLRPKSKTFYKMYIINIALMICFISVLSVTCTKYSSKFILNNITDFNQKIIDGRRDILDDKIRQLNEVADAAVADDNVIRLILADSNQYYSSLKMMNIIGSLKEICSNYSIVDEISIVDYDRGIVITNRTKFPLSELESQNFINTDPLFFLEEDGEIKVRYIKKLNPVQNNKKISIILTVNQAALKDNLFLQNNESFKEYLLAKDGMALSNDGLEGLEHMEKWEPVEGKSYLKSGSESIVYRSLSEKTGLTVIGLQDYSQITSDADKVAVFIIIMCVVIVILASLILYFFSLYFYKPLKKLSDHISNFEVVKQNKTKNEYDYIERVVDTLQGEKEQIQKKYEEALPVMIQKTSYRLIVENYEEEAFQYLLGILKRKMSEKYYVLLLVECEEKGYLHELEERLLHLIQAGSMEAVYVDLNVLQGMFLINTSLESHEFFNCLNQWKKETGDKNSTWCVSSYFSNRDNVNLVCWETIDKLKRKFFKEKNSVISDLPRREKAVPASVQKIEQQLLSAIKEGNGGEALGLLHTFTEELTAIQVEIRYTVFIYFQICDRLLSDLKVADAIISKEYNEKAVFLELFSAENIYELEMITARMIQVCLENVGKSEKMYSDSVNRTLDFIKNNYHRDLTLEDIANEVYLSAGYLSSIFKEETGCTVIEYMTGVRMKKATELLFEIPVIKVKDIAERLGYHNVQSFIRYFKKYYGVAPAEFRKRQQIDE